MEYATRLIFLYVKSMPGKLCEYMSITMMLNIKNDKRSQVHLCLTCFLTFANLCLLALPPEICDYKYFL